MQIQPGRQPEVIAITAEPAQQRVLGDQRPSLAGKQVDAVIHATLSVRQPIGDHLRRPVKDSQHTAAFVR